MTQALVKHDSGFDLSFIERLVRPGTGPCVSIIVELHREMNQRKQNHTIIQQAVRKADAVLDSFSCSASTRQLIHERLHTLVTSLNYDQPGEGIGLFVSPDVATLVSFPFRVNEMVLVGNSFETRDILCLKQYLRPYYIVSLTRESARLFRAQADSMQEVSDGGFPFQYVDDYEYSRSTLASSVGYGMKGFEKDKSFVSDMRSKSFVRAAAHHLCHHGSAGETEIVVCGPDRLVGEFADGCAAKDRILVKVPGTYNAGDFASLGEAAWKECQSARKQQIDRLIIDLDELGLNYKATGLRDAWAAATKGNGLLLLVERDYQREAYVPDGVLEIRLHPPKGKYQRIADAVDDVIEKVLRAGGKVVFTETNQLRKFEQVGLMLRHK